MSTDLTLVTTATDGTPTTTSLIIAQGTETQHESVMRLIDGNLADFEQFGRVRFEIGTFETAGGPQRRRTATLTEEHATLLLTYMRNSDVVKRFKIALVKAFFELRNRVQQQSPELDMARGLLAAQQMLAAKDEKIAELEAPAKSWNLLADASGDFSVAEAAKILSRDPAIATGRDRLFAYMAERKWIMRSRNRRGGWEAYQTSVDAGRLVEKPAKPFLNSKTGEYELPSPTIRVTVKGIGKLHELMGGTEPIHFVAGEAA